MDRMTYERALHMWPEWGESIRDARLKLSYDPGMPGEAFVAWIEQHYPAVSHLSRAELERLKLPPNLQDYWEDCFYSDYQQGDGSVNFDRITRCRSERKTLPKLPYEAALAWEEEEDIYAPWLRIEIRLHSGFLTRRVLALATQQAFETAMTVMAPPDGSWRKPRSHPVAKNIARAKDNRAEYSKMVLGVYRETNSIDETLRRIYVAIDEEDSLRFELSMERNERMHAAIRKRHYKKFYDKVTAVLRRAGVEVPRTTRKAWWPEHSQRKNTT